jgi:hypothetical protein
VPFAGGVFALMYVDLWMRVLKTPKEAFAAEKKNADVAEGAKQLALAFAIPGLLAGLVFAFLGSLIAAIPGAGIVAGFGLLAIVAAPILFAVFGVVTSLVANAIAYGVSRVLGGTGTYAQQYYLGAIFTAPITIASLVLNIVPILGSLVSLLLQLYGLYLFVLSLKEAHGFDTMKAVLVIVGLVVVYAVLVAVLGGALLFGLAGASSAGSTLYG